MTIPDHPVLQTQVKAAAITIQKVTLKINIDTSFDKQMYTNQHPDLIDLVSILESCFRSMNANREEKETFWGSSPVGCFLRESPELFGLKQLFHVPLSAVLFYVYLNM